MHIPLISTIIPIYNIEEYIALTIDSVINQSIGFSDNIELILIDDGSTDKSAIICQQYIELYPDNIKLIKQKNAGVSVARNKGLTYCRGEYIHFLDGDDLISRDFYKEMVGFLDTHLEIDLVASKILFFDEIKDSHPLNGKFKRDSVIDLIKEPDNPILHVTACLFRSSSIKGASFDENITISEDVKFLSDVLVRKKKYGVMQSPSYYYRKRTSSVSAMGGSRKNKDFYMSVPNQVYGYMLDKWMGKSTAAEYTVLYDLSYRLDQQSQSVLSDEDERLYKDSILAIASRCSDETITTHRFLSVHQKLYLLRAKHGESSKNHIKAHGSKIYFGNLPLYSLTDNSLHIDFLNPRSSDEYMIEGYVDGVVDVEGVSILAEINGQYTALTWVNRKQREKSFLGDTYYSGGAFEVSVKVPAASTLKFVVRAGDEVGIMPITTGPFTRFGSLRLTYRRDENRLFKRLSNKLQSYPYSRIRHTLLEARLWVQILLNWRLGTVRQRLHKLQSLNLAQLSLKEKLREFIKPWFFMAEAIFYIPRALILRSCYYAAKQLKRRPIWIISDRGMAAGDNGEALFRYIMSQDDCPADVYFVISKKSKSFRQLQSVGKVLKQESLRYKLKFLLADKIISSQADVETTNPFLRQQDHYIDLFSFDFVFLQHGIIRHDLSAWLNRFNKNIALFVTSAQKEYDSIFGNPYYYEKSNVLLSGLARYDFLESSPDGTLILAPTYRKKLIAHQPTDKLGRRRYDVFFKNSEYRHFYNDFMNDGRILRALKMNNMKGELYLHPSFSAQLQDFEGNDLFKVMAFPYDYKTAFKKGSMLVSDHSSVVFDFAYLKKPVAYAHFDVDTFFEGHSYDKSSFFNDVDDGFGEVYGDYDSLVNGVIQTIETGCLMPRKYKKRVDEFFYKVDKENSKRIYDAIVKMDA